MSAVQVRINLDSRISFDGQFREQLRKLLAMGDARPGTRLPTIRELAVELGINANYLKRLFDQLASDGYLKWKDGVGAFAIDLQSSYPLADLAGQEQA